MGQHISRVTILESRDAHGYFSFQDATIRTKENSDDGLDVLFVMVTIKRTSEKFSTYERIRLSTFSLRVDHIFEENYEAA